MKSFYLKYLFTGSVFKYIHILRYWGLELHQEFWGNTVQLTTPSTRCRRKHALTNGVNNREGND